MNDTLYDIRPRTSFGTAGHEVCSGWDSVIRQVHRAAGEGGSDRVVIVDCYSGVDVDDLVTRLKKHLRPRLLIETKDILKSGADIDRLVAPYVGEDPVFGRLADLSLIDFFSAERLADADRRLKRERGLRIVCGPGAALLPCEGAVVVYADMARWPIQQRFRSGAAGNLGASAEYGSAADKYKRAFFVDWRVLDRHKISLFDRVDYFLDTTTGSQPVLVDGKLMRRSLEALTRRPFRVVPYFDPAPWGGHWMQRHFNLDAGSPNYGWGFDCVPEENSLVLDFGGVTTEIPAINPVLRHPVELLGEEVYRRFGAEFPIRFDLLDTIGGGNLSLQVHPLRSYIREHFGVAYTQDESYYILEASPGASVYLGLVDRAHAMTFADELRRSRQVNIAPNVDAFVKRWPARKHDHFLIPAGTCHCSGAGNLVLEISATPYIFTFKLWDWGRLGLDGQPRPIHLERGLANIQWQRDAAWVEQNLINRVTPLASGASWREERTGLHRSQFIEARRHWFTGPVNHRSTASVNVLNLVQGPAACVESPDRQFDPLVIHYAETFIVPAGAGDYMITPLGGRSEEPSATIKAFVRRERTGVRAERSLPSSMAVSG